METALGVCEARRPYGDKGRDYRKIPRSHVTTTRIASFGRSNRDPKAMVRGWDLYRSLPGSFFMTLCRTLRTESVPRCYNHFLHHSRQAHALPTSSWNCTRLPDVTLPSNLKRHAGADLPLFASQQLDPCDAVSLVHNFGIILSRRHDYTNDMATRHAGVRFSSTS